MEGGALPEGTSLSPTLTPLFYIFIDEPKKLEDTWVKDIYHQGVSIPRNTTKDLVDLGYLSCLPGMMKSVQGPDSLQTGLDQLSQISAKKPKRVGNRLLGPSRMVSSQIETYSVF